jgi:hypothetical protein
MTDEASGESTNLFRRQGAGYRNRVFQLATPTEKVPTDDATPNQIGVDIGSNFRGPMGSLAQGRGTRNGFVGSGDARRLASMKIG